MNKDILMSGETITLQKKPSLMSEGRFWLGITLFAVSIVFFVLVSFFAPKYNISISRLLSLVGFSGGIPLFGSLPAIPTILEIIGAVYIIYAELAVYFKIYIVTNNRVIYQHGILSKQSNIIIPSKISDVSVDLGPMDRLLHIGKVIIRREEQTKPQVKIVGLRDPYKFQDTILKLVNRYTYHTPENT